MACTAAITDDIKPEWNQDHGKTKKVTLAVAAFATGISLVGQGFPGFGDSVFALVVFAVYGLGGIFVPLILIRMAGYEPDTRHTTLMMIAALLGVLIWTTAGFGEYVFPSVPGMRLLLLYTSLLLEKRGFCTSNPFGRYSVPTKKISAIGAVILIGFVGVMEGSYQAFSPKSSSMSGKIGTYTVNGTYSFHEIAVGSEFIEDGESIPIDANSDDSVDSLDGLNLVGVKGPN